MSSAKMPGVLHHHAASKYRDALIAQGSTVWYSELLRLEFPQVLVAVGNDPRQLSGAVRRRFRLQHWGRLEDVRREWLREGMDQFESFVRRFDEVYEADIDEIIRENALEIMARCQIRSYDAIHASTALAVGCTELVTVDADFIAVHEAGIINVRLIRDP
jgi:predicted nucleic acid-binding protein